MTHNLWRSGLVFLYSFCWFFLTPAIKFFALLPLAASRRLNLQLKDRQSAATIGRALVAPRAAVTQAAHFFCSSAGEFEQAKPLIDRLQRQGMFVHVSFFSSSGLEFAKARGETVSCSLTPARDTVFDWGHIYSALRPAVTIVVRHELWPGMLATARQFGALYLIDASRSLGERDSGIKRLARAWLLGFFDKIFCVADTDRDFFKAAYGLPDDRLFVTGDTKYDRVIERAQQTVSTSIARDKAAPGRRRLIAGSAHKPDVEALIGAWKTLGPFVNQWQVIVAPHHLDAANIAAIEALWRGAGVTPQRLSSLTDSADAPVVLVDRMGLLADMYASSELAFVGGASHHQVHNVLEPACHGLAIAFGPFYKNSQEAVRLVDTGLATVCRGAGELAHWWQRHSGPSVDREPMLAAVRSLAGSTERILAEVQPFSHAR